MRFRKNNLVASCYPKYNELQLERIDSQMQNKYFDVVLFVMYEKQYNLSIICHLSIAALRLKILKKLLFSNKEDI